MTQAEKIIRPKVRISEKKVAIEIHDSFRDTSVSVCFPEKNEQLIKILKQKGFSWNFRENTWKRYTNHRSGTASDRASELATILVNAGFIVSVSDSTIMAAALTGAFEPECTRWIIKINSGKYAGWFGIHWHGSDDITYHAARRIDGSRWHTPYVVVPADKFEDVVDFAQIYSFNLSPGAEFIVKHAKSARDPTLTFTTLTESNEDKHSNNKDPPNHLPKTGKIPSLDVPTSVKIDDEFKD